MPEDSESTLLPLVAKNLPNAGIFSLIQRVGWWRAEFWSVILLFESGAAFMKYFLLPKKWMGVDKESWIDASGVSLGGCFYDYFCRESGEVAGVRYWVDNMDEIDQHPVWRLFLDDPRVMFIRTSNCIDMVFDDADVTLFLEEKLHVMAMQDFGGDGVVSSGTGLGVVFVLPDSFQSF